MARDTERLNARIKAKLRELDDDREERKRANQLLHRKESRVDELRDELVRVRKRIKRRSDAVADLREDLDRFESETEEETPEEIEIRARLDQLSGELDEAIAIRGRIIERLDRLRDERDDAKQALEKILDESGEDRAALRRMRERRRRMREKRERPSPNFTYAEFDTNDGTPVPEQSYPAIKDWCQRIGEPLRQRFGSVHINSGYRHRAYNARIGGEPNSVHIYDFPGRDHKAVAVDFTCERGTPRDWYAFTAGKADGRGLYNTFHHADTRNRIGWSDATWTG